MTKSSYPKLRQLDFQPIFHDGQQMWLPRDPLQLSQEQILLPPLLAQVAVYCDGKSDYASLQARLLQETGVQIPLSAVEELIAALDENCLLDNARSQAAVAKVRDRYRAQPYRPLVHAGLGFSRDPEALSLQLQAYAAEDEDFDAADWKNWRGRAVISPHIDYQRGGDVYAQVWRRAAATVQSADLILMFATDHHGGLGSLTLTPQPYATPYGIIPTDEDLVEKLAQAIGEEKAYEFELNHLHEHSVELVSVWQHYAGGGESPPMVPILCGSFQHFLMNGAHPAEDEAINALIETLIAETEGKRVLCVASADFAHVGPAFQDDFVMDGERREALCAADESLIEAISHGNEVRFYDEIAAVQDANKVCGFSPIYLMLRYLNGRADATPITGRAFGYRHCPADAEDHSLVSICGMLLE